MLDANPTDAQVLSGASSARDGLVTAFGFYYLTTLIVIAGVVFGFDFVQLCRAHPGSRTRTDALSGFAAWDGEWYVKIATQGYSYDPGRNSSVAFYPAYPLLAGAVVRATSLRAEWALLLVSHASLFAAFALLAAYVRRRFPEASLELGDYVLLAAGLFPTTFYFRMTYSESLFLLTLILAMYAMERKWPAVVVALVAGAATATRLVGVALTAPLLIYLWQRSGTKWAVLPKAIVLLPLAWWGLLAYMAYQQATLGDPLAFVKTQVHWTMREPANAVERAVSLATFEPIRAVYDPSSRCYWGRVPPRDNPLFNLNFANPVYFVFTVVLVGVGAKMRWLSSKECALSALLLLIPYVTQAYRTCMASEARYASVVFPAYIVMGHLLWRMPAPLAAMLLSISAVLLGIYAALFASWYWFY